MFSQPRCRTLTKNRRDDAWNEGTNGYRFTFSERPRGIPPSAYARSRSVIKSQVGVPRLARLPSISVRSSVVLSREERVEGPSRATWRLGSSSLGKARPVMVGKLVFRRTSLSLRPFNLSAKRQYRELRIMSDVNCWALDRPVKKYWEELLCAP